MNKQKRRNAKFISFIDLSINPNEEISFETPDYTIRRDKKNIQNLLSSCPFIFFKIDNMQKKRIDVRNTLKFWTKKTNKFKNYFNRIQMQATNNNVPPFVTNQSSLTQNANTGNNNKADDKDNRNIIIQNDTNNSQKNEDTGFNLIDNSFSLEENNDFDDFDDFLMDGFFN